MTGRLKGATSRLTINGVRIDRIIECSVPLEPIRNFLPSLTAETLARNRHWMQPWALDRQDQMIVCIQSYVVRTAHHTNFEAKLKKRTQTSGCAQGTAFGDLLEAVESVALPVAELRTSWLYQMTHTINTMPSLYLEAGAIHGCVLCKQGTPVCYTEDVGRHNAVDKIAGWIYRHGVDPADKILYTTGRLTSEMVIKTIRMGIPILVSRSGFTAWGVDLARQVGLTLVGRTRGKRFIALSGQERIVHDQNLDYVEDESARHKRKGEARDD